MEPRIARPRSGEGEDEGTEDEDPASREEEEALQPQKRGAYVPYLERRGLASADAVRYGALLSRYTRPLGRSTAEAAGLVDHALLRDMGVVVVGHRIKILKALRDLVIDTQRPSHAMASDVVARSPAHARRLHVAAPSSPSSSWVSRKVPEDDDPVVASLGKGGKRPKKEEEEEAEGPPHNGKRRKRDDEQRTQYCRHTGQIARADEMQVEAAQVQDGALVEMRRPSVNGQGDINAEIRAAVAAVAEDLGWNRDSDNDEEHSGTESEAEDEKCDPESPLHAQRALSPQPVVAQDLPRIDFSLIKDGQSDNLKHFILSSFQAAQCQPRSHQWESVFKVVLDLLQPVENLEPSCMKNFLLQHATGSGKSLTIACLTCCLYLLRDIWESDRFKYNKIVVMNDRKILDEQLGDTVLRFLHANGISDVQRSKSSTHLAELMRAERPRVIITTMQKFVKLDKVQGEIDIGGQQTVAIIADEAHRSHGRKNTRTMHEFLTGFSRQSNRISYFSFTCTPNYKALEMFGVRGANGAYEPFHTYSIEHCIRDGHVLNPLMNYQSVGIYAKLIRKQSNDTVFDEGQHATYHLVKNAADDRVLLKEKARYVVEHFLEVLDSRTSDTFKPKGMLVSSSRKHVIWYKEEIERIVAALPEHKGFDVVAAFTQFIHEGKRVSETDVELNGKYARNIVKSFKDPNSRVKLIIVADKFQTGFDEPLLHTLYIDKRLRGSNAVQTIGRANRSAPGKYDTCVVDFVNSRNAIGQAFALYWKTTSLKCITNRAPQETKLDRVSTRLLQVPGLEECSIRKCIDHISIEDALRIKADNSDRLIEDDLRQYLALCDRLQVENKKISYSFVRRLLHELALFRHRRKIESFKCLLDDVTITVEKVEEEKGSISLGTEGQKLQMPSDEISTRHTRQDKMTTNEIVVASNHVYNSRISSMWDSSKPRDDLSAVPEIDKSTLEFAQAIWAARAGSTIGEAEKRAKDQRLAVPQNSYGVLDREELTRRGLLSKTHGKHSTRERSPSPPLSDVSLSASVSECRLPPLPSKNSELSLSFGSLAPSSPSRLSASDEERSLRRTRGRRPPPLRLVIKFLSMACDDKDRRKALRALRDHVTSEESWTVVRELDGLRPLIALISNTERSTLEDISSNLSERGWAIAALSELARDERNRDDVRELQGIQPLLRLISPSAQTPPYIQELALKALRNLCLDNAANQKVVLGGGLSDITTHLLQTAHPHLQLEAAATLSALSDDTQACVMLKEHYPALHQLLASAADSNPPLLSHIFHMIKRLCQVDVDFRKQVMKDEALWYLTNRHLTSLESLSSEAQSLRAFLDPGNFNHYRPSKRFVPNLSRSRNETCASDEGGASATANLRRSRSSSVQGPPPKQTQTHEPNAGPGPGLPREEAPIFIARGGSGAEPRAHTGPVHSRLLLRRSRSNSAPMGARALPAAVVPPHHHQQQRLDGP